MRQKLKQLLRAYYARPENIAEFSKLFPNHIQSKVPEFHKEIYQEQTKLEGYVGIAAPRGFSKSTVTDLVFLLWCALNVKRHFIVLISDSFSQAVMMLESAKEEIESNELIQWLYENPSTSTWANDDIEIEGINATSEPVKVKVMAKGAGMKVRGLKYLSHRPDLILIDDLENDELVRSEDRRRKLKKWITMSVIPALAKDGCIVAIGTVLHRDSLINNILQKKDEFASWRSRKYQAITEGESLWPDRFPVGYLEQMRNDPKFPHYLGPNSFTQEMMKRSDSRRRPNYST